MENKGRTLSGVIMLLIAALLWGIAFVAQSEGMDYIGALSFNSIRMFLGGIILIPVILVLDKVGVCHKPKDGTERKNLFKAGITCGIALTFATILQQIGLKYTTSGKAGFITTLYIILIPIFSLFLGKKMKLYSWICVLVAAVGLYMLCIKGSLSINIGDMYVCGCSVLFSVHLLLLDYYAGECDAVRLSCIQFLTVGVICGIIMLFVEGLPTWDQIYGARVSILYTAICSSGIAYTLQALAQERVNPVLTSLVMSLESVFSALAGWIILHESMSAQELIGCGLILGAIIASNLLGGKDSKQA